MKIALIQPAKPVDKSTAAEHWNLCRPMSLLYLARAVERSQLHQSKIFDLELLFASRSDLVVEDLIASLDFDVFGVTATTFTRHEAVAIIKMIRKFHPAKKIIVGGVHFMHCDADTLTNLPEVDIVVRGEGEITLVELLDALQEKVSLERVPGITYRGQNGKIQRNPDFELFEDLDKLDIYNLRSALDYPEYLMGADELMRAVSLMTSRGCPYSCVFCAKAGMKYRHRSTQSVIRELKYYVEEMGITAFNLLDLTFTANPQRSRELCEAIIAERLNIQWWCETRANVPLDLITLMHRAGCRYVVVGVESGSPAVLKRIQKGVSLDQVEKLFLHTQQVGIKATAYFMCSLVGETYEDARQTLRFINRIERLYGVTATLQPCIILPGTEIERIARTSGALSPSFSWADDFQDPNNADLGQLTTIPLFLDLLTREQISDILCKNRRKDEIRSRYRELSFEYFKVAWKVHGLKKLVKIMVDDFYTTCISR